MADCDGCIQAIQGHAPFPKKAKSQSKEPSGVSHALVLGPVCSITLPLLMIVQDPVCTNK